MEKEEHTPLPWEVEAGEGLYPIITSQKFDIAQILPLNINDENEEANADFIVTAVNSHDKLQADNAVLVTALKNCIIDAHQQLTQSERLKRIKEAEQALAQTKGES